MLMSNEELCVAIENKELNKIWTILDELEKFPNQYILPSDSWEELVDLIYQNRRNELCSCLSKKLDKIYRQGEELIIIDNERYQSSKQELDCLNEKESDVLKDILLGNGRFFADRYLITFNKGSAIRSVATVEDLQIALIVFGNSIVSEEEFSVYIGKVYQGLWFDKDIVASMKRLEAGFSERRAEILYQLYCIEKEIPAVIASGTCKDNQSIGDAMTISCSPERKREVVKEKLTKKVDNGELKCELHTKMKKIGSRKPDRIYFCASVPQGIVIDKKDAGGRIYIYKITEHV